MQQLRSACGRNTTGQLHAPSLHYRPLRNACFKGISISDTSITVGAEPGFQAVSPQSTYSHKLPLLSIRPTVTFQARQHYAAQ